MDVSQTPGAQNRTGFSEDLSSRNILTEAGRSESMSQGSKAVKGLVLNVHSRNGGEGLAFPVDEPSGVSNLGDSQTLRGGTALSEEPLLQQLIELSGLPEEFIESELVPSLPAGEGSEKPVTLDGLRAAMLELLDRMNEDMGGEPPADL
jgi:hypothetical protein